MINFQYARASDVADAVRQIAAAPGAKFIAGGTNLIDLMRKDVDAAGAADRHLAAAAEDAWRRRRTAACASARWCRIPISPTTR